MQKILLYGADWDQPGSKTVHTTGTEGGYCLAVRRYLVLRPLLPS